jgi:hypothetical protein
LRIRMYGLASGPMGWDGREGESGTASSRVGLVDRRGDEGTSAASYRGGEAGSYDWDMVSDLVSSCEMTTRLSCGRLPRHGICN